HKVLRYRVHKPSIHHLILWLINEFLHSLGACDAQLPRCCLCQVHLLCVAFACLHQCDEVLHPSCDNHKRTVLRNHFSISDKHHLLVLILHFHQCNQCQWLLKCVLLQYAQCALLPLQEWKLTL